MKIDINFFNTFETRNTIYTNQWRTTYEVMQSEFFTKSDVFSDDSIKNCKDNANKAINIPTGVKMT